MTNPVDRDHSIDNLERALQDFVLEQHILIALDFDGTLAPLVDDPEDSRMLPRAAQALFRLTDMPGVRLALVSGRAIDSLLRVANPRAEWFLVGSHGGEIVAPGDHHSYRAQVLVPPELDEAFEKVAQDHPGTRLERKAFGLALHTRGVESSMATRAQDSARAVCEEWHGELSIRVGHGILECSVLTATKADGVLALQERTGARATLFAGDDVTDEDAIAVLGPMDIGIWVGPGESTARFRLPDAEAVSLMLESLATQRSNARP